MQMQSELKGELEHIPANELERAIRKWARSICVVCGREYLHSRYYKPSCCLRVECILALRGELTDYETEDT